MSRGVTVTFTAVDPESGVLSEGVGFGSCHRSADSVTVADRVTVTPTVAGGVAEPTGVTVTAAMSPPGTARWVTLEVAADTTQRVDVTCSHNGASATAWANLKANPTPDAGDCDDPLGTLSSVE